MHAIGRGINHVIEIQENPPQTYKVTKTEMTIFPVWIDSCWEKLSDVSSYTHEERNYAAKWVFVDFARGFKGYSISIQR